MSGENNRKKEIQCEIHKLLKEYYQLSESPFDPYSGRVELSFPTYNGEDVSQALDSILKGWPTIGPKVRKVEDKIASLVGVKNAIMVSSGGAANFLILYFLSSCYTRPEDRLNKGDEIITPAVTWSTTVSPIIQCGCVPVFADVNLQTYAINPEEIEKNIREKTRAVMIVHPMGCPCDMDKIVRICKKHSLLLIEDCCESIGARYKKQHVGAFGEFGSLSFYFSHHITSIEGGVILINDDTSADVFRCMRANGWFREIRNQRLKDKLVKENPHLDTSFLFPYIGFNLKPTDVAAGFVIGQIDRLEGLIQKRAVISGRLTKLLEKYSDHLYLPIQPEDTQHSWFAYPVVVKENATYTKKALIEFLKDRRIDTRPIIAGNIASQPFLKDYRFKKGDLTNSELVMKNGFFLGVHHRMDDRQVGYIQESFDEFFTKKGLLQNSNR